VTTPGRWRSRSNAFAGRPKTELLRSVKNLYRTRALDGLVLPRGFWRLQLGCHGPRGSPHSARCTGESESLWCPTCTRTSACASLSRPSSFPLEAWPVWMPPTAANKKEHPCMRLPRTEIWDPKLTETRASREHQTPKETGETLEAMRAAVAAI